MSELILSKTELNRGFFSTENSRFQSKKDGGERPVIKTAEQCTLVNISTKSYTDDSYKNAKDLEEDQNSILFFLSFLAVCSRVPVLMG